MFAISDSGSKRKRAFLDVLWSQATSAFPAPAPAAANVGKSEQKQKPVFLTPLQRAEAVAANSAFQCRMREYAQATLTICSQTMLETGPRGAGSTPALGTGASPGDVMNHALQLKRAQRISANVYATVQASLHSLRASRKQYNSQTRALALERIRNSELQRQLFSVQHAAQTSATL